MTSTLGTSLLILATLAGCKPPPDDAENPPVRVNFEVIANVLTPELREISGMEVLDGPRDEPWILVHNDDGEPDIYVLDGDGELQAIMRLNGAKNRDWEDLTLVPGSLAVGGARNDRSLLAIGEIGDNQGQRESVRIYFIDIARYIDEFSRSEPISVEVEHILEMTYPDGPRDCEAMAYDASTGQILLLTKRDKPPRLYAIDAATALTESKLELEYQGSTSEFRPPTRIDLSRLGQDATWVSQPTGMDINADGTLAAVITYRSLYLFGREPGQSWVEAFQSEPREFLGPQSRDEEAIAFDESMKALFISTEGHPAPIYRVALPEAR